MATAFVPERGDLVWLDFDPQAGREQAGRRPALVLSSQTFTKGTTASLQPQLFTSSREILLLHQLTRPALFARHAK